MGLLLSSMAIGAFCAVAVSIEAIITREPRSNKGLSSNKRNSRSRRSL